MNGNQHSLLIAAALIWHNGELLLVKQQGPDDPEPTWALPGGVVKHGELLSQALARELREETGLNLTQLGPLIYVAQLVNEMTGACSTTFVCEVSEWEGALAAQDPDALILDARFMSVDDALAKLARLPWRVMREPIQAYLRGEFGPGGFWGYRSDPAGNVTLVESPENCHKPP